LEREIQSLRDRHTHNTNVIADIRASKRKLEDTIEGDRVARRRLQRELDEVAKERDNARRMENLALDQMKREVDSRRRAEDRADEERELRRRAESSAEFAMLQRTAAYIGVPRITPMAAPESFSAFDSHPHRISF
jgi:chromosome segregation ATPase